MKRMNRPDICECGHSHYVGKITKPLDSCTHCECEKYTPSPHKLEQTTDKRFDTDMSTQGSSTAADTNDFKARIKELKTKEDNKWREQSLNVWANTQNKLEGMKEALEAVEKKIDKKINSPKAVRSCVRDTEMDIAFWNGYKTGLLGLNEEISAWLEELK